MIFHCDFCGLEACTTPSHFARSKHHFCSRNCLAKFSSKDKNPKKYKDLKSYENMRVNMRKINTELNPCRMTLAIRMKISKKHRESKSRKPDTYPKLLGRHIHRVVAEDFLGRPLKSGEVVHHKDSDKQNYCADNLRVFPSQREHAEWHATYKGGGAK